MSLSKQDIVNNVIKEKTVNLKKEVSEFAPSNIALCKYWGKRNKELNLPYNSSLSVSLKTLGTTTKLSLSDKDEYYLNNELVKEETSFYKKLSGYLDLFRTDKKYSFKVITENNIATAAGLASSASGFCALVKCIDSLFSYNLSDSEKSILARIGSGSASRSFWDGFVIWEKGEKEDGTDSYAYPLDYQWEDLRIAVLDISSEEKEISSRDAMNITVETSSFFNSWVKKADTDMQILKSAIKEQDFKIFGETLESNALAMHSTMMSASPSIIYFLPETLEQIKKIWSLRKAGLSLYFTADAGANLKLVFQKKDEEEIKELFNLDNIISL